MVNMSMIRRAQRPQGPASVMAIGTATPANAVDQHTYPDLYFRVTNSEHMTELKQKFQRMCEKSRIKNRYLHLTEDILKANPSLCDYKASSLNARQDILTTEIPKLGAEAGVKAIQEWGLPKSSITHLVFCSTAGVDAPGADFQLIKLLDLSPSVQRCMMYQQGCFGGGTALRIAKDLAENNKSARVLVICCEITVSTFHGPSDAHPDNLIGQAIFSDGAGAVIVGADPIAGVEKPLFEIVLAAQTIIPDSCGAIKLRTREEGLQFHLHKSVCENISDNIEDILEQTFDPLRIYDWNRLFWIVHPGGPAILDKVEDKLKLTQGKLEMSRRVLSEYGNMAGASVLFVMDKMRKKSAKEKLKTSGEGLEWGVLLGFGPGITVETVVLHSVDA